MKTVYYIREKGGKYNFSVCRGKNKLMDSHRQDYSRKCDAVEVARNNVKSPYSEKEVTRAEFNRLFRK